MRNKTCNHYINIFILFGVIILLFTNYSRAQDHWDNKFYNTINHSNFRQYGMFNKAIDKHKIDYPLLHAAVFFVTNEHRSKHNMPALKHSQNLEVAAFYHSYHMATDNFFSHIDEKNKGRRSAEDRAALAGVTNASIAENIYYDFGYKTSTYLQVAERFLNSWMASKGHRSNILSRQAVAFGCGAYFFKNVWYATQTFQWYRKIKIGKAFDVLPDFYSKSRLKINHPKINTNNNNKGSSKFYIVCASYSTETNANERLNTMKKQGYKNAQIIRTDNNYRVIVDNYSSFTEAQKALNDYKIQFTDAWIMQ